MAFNQSFNQSFNQCHHEIKNILIKCGKALREAKGLPEERNISILYEEAIKSLGIPHIETNTEQTNHLPSPAEMKNEEGKFIIPRKDCPICGEKETMLLGPLCQSCKDAEGGKYKTMWQCQKCQYKDRSEKHFMKWMSELNVELPSGSKQSLGIKTYTDNGLK